MEAWITGTILLIIKLLAVLIVLLTLAAYLVWVERKLLARIQARFGPNRAWRFGLLQPLADVIKLMTKEDTVPEGADKRIFLLAPGMVGATALLIFAVIPFGPAPLVIADLNVGVLFFLAFSSIGVYGVVLGGWASNSKYSLLGGVRAAAQMISYEVSFGLSLVPIVMLAGSFSLVDIVNAQSRLPFPSPSSSFLSVLPRRLNEFPSISRKRKMNWWRDTIQNIVECGSASSFWVNTSP